jgi:hypothetical protein
MPMAFADAYSQISGKVVLRDRVDLETRMTSVGDIIHRKRTSTHLGNCVYI